MKLKLNKIVVLVAITALSTLMSSCFKEEPLNAECDIEKAWVHVSNVDAYFYSPTDSLIEVISTEDKIVFNMRDGADITALAPQFVITDGATITPASGTVHDFSHGPLRTATGAASTPWSATACRTTPLRCGTSTSSTLSLTQATSRPTTSGTTPCPTAAWATTGRVATPASSLA